MKFGSGQWTPADISSISLKLGFIPRVALVLTLKLLIFVPDE